MALDFVTDYVTVADADAYHAARGNTAWTGAASSPPDLKEAAIRRATDFIIGRYEGRWIEEIDEADIPDAVVFAICEAALREFVTPGSLTPDLRRGGDIKSVQAGSVGVVFKDSAPAETTISKIDDLLRGLITSSGVITLVRA